MAKKSLTELGGETGLSLPAKGPAWLGQVNDIIKNAKPILEMLAKLRSMSGANSPGGYQEPPEALPMGELKTSKSKKQDMAGTLDQVSQMVNALGIGDAPLGVVWEQVKQFSFNQLTSYPGKKKALNAGPRK